MTRKEKTEERTEEGSVNQMTEKGRKERKREEERWKGV